MTSLLAIPCSVMNLASRSDAEDSNALEITGFGALIVDWDIADCQLPIFRSLRLCKHQLTIGNWKSAMAGIVSQGHDKVFTLKMPRKGLFRRLFTFNEAARPDYGVLNGLLGVDLHVISKNRSTHSRTGSNFDIAPEDRVGNSRRAGN